MAHRLLSFLKNIYKELILVWVVVLTVNNYFGSVPQTIASDGKGYYDYLPSLFIYHDLARAHHNKVQDPALYTRINSLPGAYVDYKNYKVDKYPCGTAVLLSPFFIASYLFSPQEYQQNGYSQPYQRCVYYAALFYLFISLLFLRKILAAYNISSLVIFLCQLFLTFGTSVLHYTYNEASFSHIYSLFAVSGFIFFCRFYFTSRRAGYFLWALVFLGLIFLLRQINILAVLFIPFLAGSYNNLKNGIGGLWRKKSVLLKGIVLFALVCFIQSIFWYLQTGSFVLDSYQQESFDFRHPHFADILFSYKKGLFIYTPLAFICVMCLLHFVLKKEFYLLCTWLFFFLVLTYFLSSWWSWYYGASYGLRAYIEFYPAFLILLAIVLNSYGYFAKGMLVILCSATVWVNLIQTWQYKQYILHWVDMDKSKYWKVFLKQDERYKGILWKRDFDFSKLEKIGELNLGSQTIEPRGYYLFALPAEMPNITDSVNVIKVKFKNEFGRNDIAWIEFTVSDNTGSVIFFQALPLVHYADGDLGVLQEGSYLYGPFSLGGINSRSITLKMGAGPAALQVQDVKLELYKWKNMP